MRLTINELFGICALLVVVTPARADTLALRSGGTLNGSFAGGDAHTLTFVTADGTHDVRIEDVASLTFAAAAPAPAPSHGKVTVPAGTLVLARTIDAVSSNTPAGTVFAMKLDSDLRVGDALVAKAGTKLYGKVEGSKQAGRVAGSSQLNIGLDSIELGGKRVKVVSDVLVGTGQNSFKKTARRAIVGTAIGGAVGGRRGARRGAGAGAATTLLTPGQSVTVGANTLLQFSLEEPVTAPVS